MSTKIRYCPNCYTCEAHHFQYFEGGNIHCDLCNATFYEDRAIEDFQDELKRFVSEEKQERTRNLRRLLYEAAHAKYVDSKRILALCHDIRNDLPDDFRARFYEVANGDDDVAYADFLQNIDAKEHANAIEDVVRFTLRSFTAGLVLPLKNLVENAYKVSDLERYKMLITEIEQEAQRVEDGIYEPSMPRDVFVAYSSKDIDRVMELVRCLEDNGMSCFVALRNLQHGRHATDNYHASLETAMRSCRTFVLVSSPRSRNAGCDVIRHELPFVRRTDEQNAPGEYRNNYEKIPQKYKKPRVEYRIEDSQRATIADRTVASFFSGLEYCTYVDQVAERIWDYLNGGWGDAPEEETVSVPAIPEPSAPVKTVKICQRCGTENDESALFCQTCGNKFLTAAEIKALYEAKQQEERALQVKVAEEPAKETPVEKTPAEQTAVSEPTPVPDDTKICQACGEKNVKAAKFCFSCGLSFMEAPRVKESADDRPAKTHSEPIKPTQPVQNKPLTLDEEGDRLLSQGNYSQAFNKYAKAEENGSIRAQYKLGFCYEKGLGISQSEPKAIEWYVKAALRGDRDAADAVKRLAPPVAKKPQPSVSGAKTSVPQKATTPAPALAVQDPVQALVDEADRLAGQGNSDLAFVKYAKAAEAGNPSAQNKLGNCYYKGLGVARNDATAAAWYLKAAMQDHAVAQMNLGACYASGVGVQQSFTKAVEWFTKAAIHGLGLAQNNLGLCYYKGQGVAQSYEKAVEWYTKAAEQGVALAQYRLGLCYANGTGVKHDPRKAIEWYLKAANQGIKEAQTEVGLAYANGQGVAQNDVAAAAWYTKAAEAGDAVAQSQLGVCYYHGRGVSRNYAKAVAWYTKAAENGDEIAQFNLAGCYQTGISVAKDQAKAITWYTKAAQQGHARSQYFLGDFYEHGNGVEQDFAKAAEWYTKAAEQGNERAEYALGVLYEQGKGVKKDREKAIKYYSLASEYGYSPAQTALRRLQKWKFR